MNEQQISNQNSSLQWGPVDLFIDMFDGWKHLISMAYDISQIEGTFFTSSLVSLLNIKLDVKGEVASIPRQGPLMVVANHPCSLIDSFTLPSFLHHVRPGFKMFGASGMRPFLRPSDRKWFLELRVQSRKPKDKEANASAIKQGFAHMRAGGCVGLFPSQGLGVPRSWRGPVIDNPWTNIPVIAIERGIPVLPVHIDVHTSPVLMAAAYMFQAIGLRNMAEIPLALDIYNKPGSTVTMTVGKPFTREDLADLRVPGGLSPRSNKAWRREAAMHELYARANAPAPKNHG